MTREQKIKRDSKALKKYKEKLKKERKRYVQTFETYAINQRRSREAALGACCLKALDAVRELKKTKPLINGTLEYVISEQKVIDPDEKKGFHCSVTFAVASEEDAHTDEWIEKEIADTFERMMKETDEMFPEEAEDEKERDYQTTE